MAEPIALVRSPEDANRFELDGYGSIVWDGKAAVVRSGGRELSVQRTGLVRKRIEISEKGEAPPHDGPSAGRGELVLDGRRLAWRRESRSVFALGEGGRTVARYDIGRGGGPLSVESDAGAEDADVVLVGMVLASYAKLDARRRRRGTVAGVLGSAGSN